MQRCNVSECYSVMSVVKEWTSGRVEREFSCEKEWF